jgi:hypothetical protein
MRYDNPGDPVYAPNSFGGPAANPDLWRGSDYHVAGEIVRSAAPCTPATMTSPSRGRSGRRSCRRTTTPPVPSRPAVPSEPLIPSGPPVLSGF